MEQVEPFIATDLVKVFTGMRRSGKSVLMQQTKDRIISTGVPTENCLCLNFESGGLDQLKNRRALYEYTCEFARGKAGKVYLFFDEIQEVDEWEVAVNSLRVDLDCDLYLTGSNAKLLSGELATYLGGRYHEVRVFPFSFAEYCRARDMRGSVRDLMSYIRFGGMPFLLQLSYAEEPSMAYLLDLYSSIILKDVVQRNGFRDADQLDRVVSYCFSEAGELFSARNVTNVFKEQHRSVSLDSVYGYVKACEEAFLLDRVARQDVKGKNVLRMGEKVYVSDHGIRQALFRDNEPRIDRVLENIVYVELLRRGWHVRIGKVGNREVDFVAQRGNQTEYYQVSYLMPTEETRAREFGAFADIDDNFPRTVLSLDEVDFSRDGIRHRNLAEWLFEGGAAC